MSINYRLNISEQQQQQPVSDSDPIYYQDTSSTWVLPFRLDLTSQGSVGGHNSWTYRNSADSEIVANGGWNNEPYARFWPRVTTEGNHGLGIGQRNFISQNPGVTTLSVRYLMRIGPTWGENNPLGLKIFGTADNTFASYNSGGLQGSNNPSGYNRLQFFVGDYGDQCDPGCKPSGYDAWPPASPNVFDYNCFIFGEPEEQRTPGQNNGTCVNEWVCCEYIVNHNPGDGNARGQLYYWTQDGALSGLAIDGRAGTTFGPIYTIEGIAFYWGNGASSDRYTTAQSYMDVCAVRFAAGEFGNPQGPPTGFVTG